MAKRFTMFVWSDKAQNSDITTDWTYRRLAEKCVVTRNCKIAQLRRIGELYG